MKKENLKMQKFINSLCEKYKKYQNVECIYLKENEKELYFIIVEKHSEIIERFIVYDNNMLKNIDCINEFGKNIIILFDKDYKCYFNGDNIREKSLKDGNILYDKTGLYIIEKERLNDDEKTKKLKKEETCA